MSLKPGTVWIAILALGVAPRQAGDQPIPIRGGVILSYAVKDTWFNEDVDMWVEIRSADSTGVRLQATIANPDTEAAIRSRPDIIETVSPGELLGARTITFSTMQGDTAGLHPRTPMLASRRIWRRLTNDGRADIRMVSFWNGERVISDGVLMADPKRQPIPVLIDGSSRELPTIVTDVTLTNIFRGTKHEQKLWFLDDSSAAWIVRSESRFPSGTGHTILRSVERRGPEAAKTLEKALEKDCRATSYGFYFRFGSARLESGSIATVDQVASLLREHSDWVVTVEGHTDSVGNPEANRLLSERRAQAVRAAVIARPGVGAARVTAAGFGKSRPVADNKTLDGRARNRRVDLVRKC